MLDGMPALSVLVMLVHEFCESCGIGVSCLINAI